MNFLSDIINKLTQKRGGFLAALSFMGILIFWQILSSYFIPQKALPPPRAVAKSACELIVSGELFKHIGASLQRVLVGFALGSFVGIIFGTLMGRIKIVRNLLDPAIEVIRPVSAVAMIPLAILWFGIEEPSRYFIIFYATLFNVLLNTAAGVSATPVIRIRAAKFLGFKDRQIFLKVIIPSAVPYILTGMRVGLGYAFTGLVASEMIAASSGIGYLIIQSRETIQVEKTFVGLLTLGIVGLIIDRIFRASIDKTLARYMEYLYNV